MSADTQGDRLSVITRNECPLHGNDTSVAFTEQDVLRCGRAGCRRELVEVEYVPASQLRGAVDRAEKAEAENRLLRETCRINGWPEFGELESTDLLRDGGQ